MGISVDFITAKLSLTEGGSVGPQWDNNGIMGQLLWLCGAPSVVLPLRLHNLVFPNLAFTKAHLYHAHLYHTLKLPHGSGNNRKEGKMIFAKGKNNELARVGSTIFGGCYN